jgi:DNA-binding response OmpR family regulator
MSAPIPRPLAGRRVLIVEDRYLIASDVAEQVRSLGADVAGPSPSIAHAGAILDAEPVDVALLDIDLDGELVYPVAEMLDARGVPFIFLTGYDREHLPQPWRTHPRLAKPLDLRELHDELLAAAATRGKGGKSSGRARSPGPVI